MQQTPSYNRVAKSFHWLMALGIFAALGLGWLMTDIPGITPTKLKYFNWHKWLGVTLFALAVARLAWRTISPPPPASSKLIPWQRTVSEWMHWALYAAMLGMPLSGYFYSLAAGFPVVWMGVVPLPVLIDKNIELAANLKLVHIWTSKAFALALIAHIGAAWLHKLYYRDGVMERMAPRFGR